MLSVSGFCTRLWNAVRHPWWIFTAPTMYETDSPVFPP